MGLFSSSKSSTQQQHYDQRVVAEEGAIVASGGSSINMLDAGAIAAAFDFARDSLTEGRKSVGEALNWANEGIGAVAQAYDQAKGEATQKNLIAAAALAAVAIVAIKAWAK